MSDRFDPVTLARLHDEARLRAQALRREAIGELMSDVGRALDRAADHASRAANRWAHALSRHQRRRRSDAWAAIES